MVLRYVSAPDAGLPSFCGRQLGNAEPTHDAVGREPHGGAPTTAAGEWLCSGRCSACQNGPEPLSQHCRTLKVNPHCFRLVKFADAYFKRRTSTWYHPLHAGAGAACRYEPAAGATARQLVGGAQDRRDSGHSSVSDGRHADLPRTGNANETAGVH